MSSKKNNALSEQNNNTSTTRGSSKKQDPLDKESKVETFFQNPTFFGMDYFRVIYGSAGILALLMVFVYLSVEDEQMKRMTLVQGGLSVFLILVTGWYHAKVEQKKQERIRRQSRQKNE
ncbi:UNKNOWN [Stylonychia lemnae]|uniref:Uncharacterized protein n=1 Tax=Stylonychia lemnae TaxID=5949 RepID=A0A078B7V7_STYLE|nr:UNKNOWN [Stylonychia lemnae]|eukprot:CDW90469.1 UNKNOWN [Stylonychia lemnae]